MLQKITSLAFHIENYFTVPRISKSLQRIRKAQNKKRDRMYTYFKEIDHVFRFALYGCVAKIIIIM